MTVLGDSDHDFIGGSKVQSVQFQAVQLIVRVPDVRYTMKSVEANFPPADWDGFGETDATLSNVYIRFARQVSERRP
jgi:hypothetical protein